VSTLCNPYIHRRVIKDPSHFIDRNREVKEVLDHTATGESVSIVGPRHIGKSSLLFYLSHKARELEAGTGTEHLYVFLDCQRQPKASQSTIYQWIWNETLKCARSVKGLPVTGESTEEYEGTIERLSDKVESDEEFESAIGDLCDAGFEITLLLDEFELVVANSALDAGFFTRLRGLTTAYPVSYVTSSTRSLLDLHYARKDVLGSPFFTIFHRRHLGLLTHDDAKELILEELQRIKFPAFIEEEIEFLFDLAGYHPALLQMACYYLFEKKATGQETSEQTKDEVRRQFEEAVDDCFRYAWEGLTESEQEAMRLICTDQAGKVGSQRWNTLEHQCLVYERKPFSSVFKEFVLQESTADMVQGPELKVRTSPPVLDLLIGTLVLLTIISLVVSALLRAPALLYISAVFLFIVVILVIVRGWVV
jgi:hypothetical protein